MPGVRWQPQRPGTFPRVELVVVDEAGLVLIGMPGLQRRLTRYPQLHSRVGFAHEYRPLGQREFLDLLATHAPQLGLELRVGTLDDPDTLAAIARITGGNFRLLQRLFAQINRIAAINDLTTVTRDVVETARESLIIGTV
jgi:DNA transposition AAA+ family ATPase